MQVALTEKSLANLRKVEWEFHVRAFGLEQARVNFLPEAQRRQALSAMWDFARSKGVPRSEQSADSE